MSKSIIMPGGKNKPFPKAAIVKQMNQPPSMEEFKEKLKTIMSENSISEIINQSQKNAGYGMNNNNPKFAGSTPKFTGNRFAGNNLAGFSGAVNKCSDIDSTGTFKDCNTVDFDNTGIRYSFSNFDTIISYIMGVLRLKNVFDSGSGVFTSGNWISSTITPTNVQTYILNCIQYMFSTADYRKLLIIRYQANLNLDLTSPTLDYTLVTDVCWIMNRLITGQPLFNANAIATFGSYSNVSSIDCRPATCLIGPAVNCIEAGTCDVSTQDVINTLSETVRKLLENGQQIVTNGAYSANVQVLLRDEDLVNYTYLSTNFVDTSMNQIWFVDMLTDFYLSVYRQIICSNGVDRTKQDRASYFLTIPTTNFGSYTNSATANIELLRADRDLLALIKNNSGALRRTNKKVLTDIRDRINVLDPSSRENCGFPSVNCVDNLDDYSSSSLTSTYTNGSTTDTTSCTTRSCDGGTCYPLYMTERQIRKLTNFFLAGVSRELYAFSFQDDTTMMISKHLLSLFEKCFRTNNEPDNILRSILFQISQNNLSQSDTTVFLTAITRWLERYSAQTMGSSSGNAWMSLSNQQQPPALMPPSPVTNTVVQQQTTNLPVYTNGVITSYVPQGTNNPSYIPIRDSTGNITGYVAQGQSAGTAAQSNVSNQPLF